MATAVDRFISAARILGAEVEPRRYPEGTRTAADAAAAIGCEVDAIVKSLVMVADDEPVLVLTSGGNRVDPALAATALGARTVRMASAEEAREATGFAIGGTPPFGHPSKLRTLLDEDLLRFDEVHAAAGTPDTNFAIAPARLQELTQATVTTVSAG